MKDPNTPSVSELKRTQENPPKKSVTGEPRIHKSPARKPLMLFLLLLLVIGAFCLVQLIPARELPDGDAFFSWFRFPSAKKTDDDAKMPDVATLSPGEAFTFGTENNFFVTYSIPEKNAGIGLLVGKNESFKISDLILETMPQSFHLVGGKTSPCIVPSYHGEDAGSVSFGMQLLGTTEDSGFSYSECTERMEIDGYTRPVVATLSVEQENPWREPGETDLGGTHDARIRKNVMTGKKEGDLETVPENTRIQILLEQEITTKDAPKKSENLILSLEGSPTRFFTEKRIPLASFSMPEEWDDGTLTKPLPDPETIQCGESLEITARKDIGNGLYFLFFYEKSALIGFTDYPVKLNAEQTYTYRFPKLSKRTIDTTFSVRTDERIKIATIRNGDTLREFFLTATAHPQTSPSGTEDGEQAKNGTTMPGIPGAETPLQTMSEETLKTGPAQNIATTPERDTTEPTHTPPESVTGSD